MFRRAQDRECLVFYYNLAGKDAASKYTLIFIDQTGKPLTQCRCSLEASHVCENSLCIELRLAVQLTIWMNANRCLCEASQRCC